MLCLGIEGTAHTFGVGIVDSRARILEGLLSVTSPLKLLKSEKHLHRL
jgi:tRNA A37 threonylcarbamoyltransferase TsaD